MFAGIRDRSRMRFSVEVTTARRPWCNCPGEVWTLCWLVDPVASGPSFFGPASWAGWLRVFCGLWGFVVVPRL